MLSLFSLNEIELFKRLFSFANLNEIELFWYSFTEIDFYFGYSLMTEKSFEESNMLLLKRESAFVKFSLILLRVS